MTTTEVEERQDGICADIGNYGEGFGGEKIVKEGDMELRIGGMEIA